MTTYPKDDLGNVRVDFVWGNVAPQPNELRTDQGSSIGGGDGDHGWNAGWQYTSDTLDTNIGVSVNNPPQAFSVGSNHLAYTTGYQNYPAYIPNYAGDGDDGLEVVVPQILRLTLSAAENKLNDAGLNMNSTAHYITATGIQSTGKTVRVFGWDTNEGNWGTWHQHLIGLRKGDELLVSLTIGGDESATEFGQVTVTAVNNDGDNSWFEFKVNTAPSPAYDDSVVGYISAGANLENIVTAVRPNRAPGTAQDPSTYINVRYFGTI